MIPDLFIIADSKCGLGHIRRQQVLEAQWKKIGGKVIWGHPTSHGVVSIDDYYFEDWKRDAWMLFNHLVVYWTEFEGDFHADIIVNQNIGAEELKYPNAKRTLLGPKYFQLREELKSIQVYSHENVFDADSVNRGLSPEEFTVCLASARAVICSAGLTAYESIYLNKPTFLRCAAENQQRTYDFLIENGFAYPYNDEMQKKLYYGWLPHMSLGKLLVDGKGAERVAKEILKEWENG